MKFTTSVFSIVALLAAFNGIAHAHGKEEHAKKSGSVKKEQMDWGVAGEEKMVQRTIVLTMSDKMRFTPEKIDVKQGETIKFIVKNTGSVMHEFVIGTKKENDEHAALMIKFPTMEHDSPYMAHVAPKKTGEVIWTFNKSGEFYFACLIAGHYQAGMVGKISVAGAGSGASTGLKR